MPPNPVAILTASVYGLGGPRSLTYDQLILHTPGLLAYFPMDDVSDTTMADIAHGHNGSYTASGWTHRVPTILPTSSRLAVAASAGTPTATVTSAPQPGNYSVEEWVNTPSTGNQCFFGLANAGNGGTWVIFGGHWYWWGGSGDINTLIVPVANVPTHLVTTFDGATRRTYVNGYASVTGSSSDSPSTTWAIINGLGSMPAGAIIQAIAVYNRALTPSEVLAHYHSAGF